MLDIDMLMKLAPASVATALASIVFPVPGGPKSNIPLHGCNKWIEEALLRSRLNQNSKLGSRHILTNLISTGEAGNSCPNFIAKSFTQSTDFF